MNRQETALVFAFLGAFLILSIFSISPVVAQSCTNDPSVCTSPPGQCYESTGTCASGSCSYPTKADGTACDDGNSNTVNDKCTGGTCAGESLSSCSEGPIPSSGCNCGNIPYYSGYCCSNAWSGSACGSSDVCGDGSCTGSETSSSCPGDCGTASGETCGNSFCGSGETMSSCPSDCYTCSEGPISSSGCYCGGSLQYGGYCCSNVYQSTACGTSSSSCSSSSIWNCYDQTSCKNAGGNWCNSYCQSSACPTCSSSQKYNCYTQSECTGVGGQWCGGTTSGYCSDSCPTCSSSQVYNCYDQTSCKNAGGNWCNNYCQSSSCPVCDSTQPWNCYDQTSCTNAKGNWCTSTAGGSGWCQSGTCATTTTGYCGDKVCNSGETTASCPSDCGTGTSGYCGDKVCSGSETSTSCPSDCGTGTGTLPSCGEGPIPFSGCKCSGANYYSGNCCSGVYYASGGCGGTGGFCGNGFCDASETSSSCPADCGGYTPTCTATNYYNCYDRASCEGVGAKWCESGGTSPTAYSPYTGSGWCNSPSYSCPSYVCDSANVWNCYTETECKSAGGYWYNNYCSSSPPPKCDSKNIYNCYDQTSCKNAGGNWCGTTSGGYCSTSACPTCSASQPWNCYEQTACAGVGAQWCKSGTGTYSNEYCTQNCPTCSSSQVWNCYTETECKSAGGYWYNNYCSSSPPPKCDSTQPWNCYEQTSCKGAGANWCTSTAGGSGWCQKGKCPSSVTQPSLGYCGWCGDSCTRISSTTACPAIVPPTGFSCLEENGACVKKSFEPKPIVSCTTPPKPPVCGPNEGIKSVFDDKGCVTGYECVTATIGLCPQIPEVKIICPTGQQLTKSTDANGCVVGYYCASTGPTPTTGLCPTTSVSKPSCSSGNVVPILTDAGCLVGYNCLPQGCWQETDPKTNVNRIVCEQGPSCTSQAESKLVSDKCVSYGGKVVSFTDPSGCTFIDCRFTDEEILPDPIKGHLTCPTSEEVEKAVSSCKSTGLVPAIAFEGGCKIAKCVQEKEQRCKFPTPEVKAELNNQCSAKGLPLVKDIDANGCPFYRCGEDVSETCAKEVPSEAFLKCQGVGGEMIVKKDDNACVVYANCITRGDERDSYVEPVEEVPDATELLQIALKLEQLKVELTKLSDQANDIAAFYANRDDEDEERFNRVAVMFEAASDRVDDIRGKIRDSLEELTVEDIIEIKRDVKHLKEVTMKDIVYMMLSNSDEVKDTIKAGKQLSLSATTEDVEQFGDNCGTDGLCFDRAFRVCKPAVHRPDGQFGPTVTIIGLGGGNCIVKAEMPTGQDMSCRFKDYSFGISGPQDFITSCEGSMIELMKQFGGISGNTGEADFPPPEGGPGGCTEARQCAEYCVSNYDDCVQWTKGHPAYGTVPPIEELERMARGEFIEEFGGGPSPGGLAASFEGPGGCKGPTECARFCETNQNTCDQWCLANPQICPQEKIRGITTGGAVQTGAPKGYGQYTPSSQPTTTTPQACVGCLNNGVCDIGECNECVDCRLR